MNQLTESYKDYNSEIVIGLVGAVGTQFGVIRDYLKTQLGVAGYDVKIVKVSADVISRIEKVSANENDHYSRISEFMDAGNKICKKHGRDSLALGVAAEIYLERVKSNKEIAKEGKSLPPKEKRAYIIDSLKRPEEVNSLRRIYPNGFFLLGVHCEESRRLKHLNDLGIGNESAKKLIERDANEESVPEGQRVTKTFYKSDFFVHSDGNVDKLNGDLKRLVELWFGNPFKTPSFDEYAMFFAFAAALRSADLSRQVGAAITNESQIIATGANDCPSFGGGLYWPSQEEDGTWTDLENGRDYKRGFDSNKLEQSKIVDKICEMASEKNIDVETLREILESKLSPISNLTEYGRVVHAEMDALTACSRSNLSTKGATLYCTTFPCHNCTKHIVAAGIERVVYIEPYEKSKAQDFHFDSIDVGFSKNDNSKVKFQPFVGVGPTRFFDLFSMNLSSGYDTLRRNPKDKKGSVINWNMSNSNLRLKMLPTTYLELELQAATLFLEFLSGSPENRIESE